MTTAEPRLRSAISAVDLRQRRRAVDDEDVTGHGVLDRHLGRVHAGERLDEQQIPLTHDPDQLVAREHGKVTDAVSRISSCASDSIRSGPMVRGAAVM